MISELKEFNNNLIFQIETLDQNDLVADLVAWQNCFYTTSTELLGEYKIY